MIVANTSVVKLSTPTIVYLSSLQSPGSFVTIRDGYPFTVSTTSGIHFLQGPSFSSISQLNEPLTVTPFTSSLWNVANSFGFESGQQSASLQSLQASRVVVSNSLSADQTTANTLLTSSITNLNSTQTTRVNIQGAVNATSLFQNGSPFNILPGFSTMSAEIASVSSFVQLPFVRIGTQPFSNSYIALTSSLQDFNNTLFLRSTGMGIQISSSETELTVNGNARSDQLQQTNTSFPLGLSTGTISISSSELFLNGSPLSTILFTIPSIAASSLLTSNGITANTSTLLNGSLQVNQVQINNAPLQANSFTVVNGSQQCVLTVSTNNTLFLNSSTVRFSTTLTQPQTITSSIRSLDAPSLTIQSPVYALSSFSLPNLSNINPFLYSNNALVLSSNVGIRKNPTYDLDVSGSINMTSILQNRSSFIPPLSTVLNMEISSIQPLVSPITMRNTATKPLARSAVLVAGGLGNNSNEVLRYSYDGNSWMQTIPPMNVNNIPTLSWNGSFFLGNGNVVNNSLQTVTGVNLIRSSDGKNWSSISATGSLQTSTITSLFWTGTKFLAGGSSSSSNTRLTCSYDGQNWFSTPTLSNFGLFHGFAQNQNRILAIGKTDQTLFQVLYSDNGGTTWSPCSGTIFTEGTLWSGNWGPASIATNGSTWVVVGTNSSNSNATIQYSFDGISFTPISSNGFLTLLGQSVTWGLDKFVAASYYEIKYSYNGVNWFNANTPLNFGFCLSVVWTGSMFVAANRDPSGLTDYNPNLYSFDGINWFYGQSNQTPRFGIRSIAYATIPEIETGNLSLTSFTPSPLSTTTNAIFPSSSNLNILTPSLVNVDGFLAVQNKHRPSLWVAVGQDTNSNCVKYSSNGLTWLNATGASFTGVHEGWAVAFNGAYWLTALNNASLTSSFFFRSENGSNWSQITANSTGSLPTAVYGLLWTGDAWLTVGQATGTSNTIQRSFDGCNWSPASSGGFSTSGQGLGFDGNRLVAAGSNSTNSSTLSLQYSDTLGRTWISTTNAFSGSARAVANNGSIWVAVGETTGGAGGSAPFTTIKYSSNGINWSNLPSASAFNQNNGGWDVVWNGSLFVAVGSDTANTIKYSYDGINWSNATGGFSTRGYKVSWSGSSFVAVGLESGNGQIRVSTDGITWSSSTSGSFNQEGHGIAFSSNVLPNFVAGSLPFYDTNQYLSHTSSSEILLQTSTIVLNRALSIQKGSCSFSNLSVQSIQSVDTTSFGIRTSNPRGILDITLPTPFTSLPNLRNSLSGDTNARRYLSTIFQSSFSTITTFPTNSAASLIHYYRDLSTIYKWQVTGASLFTGQHVNKILDLDTLKDLKQLKDLTGLIVSSADKGYISKKPNNTLLTESNAIWITESLPTVTLTTKDQDKAVWGVVTNHVNDKYTSDGQREIENPTGGFIRVNGSGEGAIWVTNINGPIQNGDYICSSVIPGHGRKQDSDKLHNYTVAKATMSCDFTIKQDSYTCQPFSYNGQSYIRAFIGCTYHCS